MKDFCRQITPKMQTFLACRSNILEDCDFKADLAKSLPLSCLLKEVGDMKVLSKEESREVCQEVASLFAETFISVGLMKHLLCTYHVSR